MRFVFLTLTFILDFPEYVVLTYLVQYVLNCNLIGHWGNLISVLYIYLRDIIQIRIQIAFFMLPSTLEKQDSERKSSIKKQTGKYVNMLETVFWRKEDVWEREKGGEVQNLAYQQARSRKPQPVITPVINSQELKQIWSFRFHFSNC